MPAARTPSFAFHRRVRLLAVLVATLLSLMPVVASAHPLGNFTVNRFSRLTVYRDHVALTVIVDQAEIPTYQSMPAIDRNGSGSVDPAESEAYIVAQREVFAPALTLQIDGQPVLLEPTGAVLEFPPGQAGLPTLRLTLNYSASTAGTEVSSVTFRNDVYADRLGWYEIVANGAGGVTLSNSNALVESASDALRAYPDALLHAPLAMSEVSFDVRVAGNGPGAGGAVAGTSSSGITSHLSLSPDRFAELITQPLDTPLGVVAAVGLALLLGGAHALTPGHGKTVVGAYLVGARGTARHALFLGLTTTITHTAGVFALGFVTLFLSRYILPERLFPWLAALSGLMVVSIGLELLRQRWQALRQPGHAHRHHHHGDLHHHGDGLLHHHSHEASANPVGWRSLLTLGVSGGLVPCPSALVLLLSAIALGRTGMGMVLILAFSIGLAGVLTAIGLLMVYAGRLFQKLPFQGRLFRLAPVFSAVFVVGVGAVITWQALAQTAAAQAVVSLLR